MPITAKQLEDKHTCVGASDTGALFNVNPHQSIIDMWFAKVHRVITPSGQAAEAGNLFEGALLDKAEERLGKIDRDVQHSAPDGIPIRANLDGMVLADGAPIDAKTSGLFGPLMDHWGDDDTDDVPPRVTLQLQTQMLCTGSDVGYVIAFLGGRGFAFYRIARNEKLINAIIERSKSFWVDYVLTQIMPPGEPPSMATLRAVTRQPKSCIDLPESAIELADQWKEAQATCTADGNVKQALHNELLAMLNNNESGRLPDGRLVTYMQYKRAAYTVEAGASRKMYLKKG